MLKILLNSFFLFVLCSMNGSRAIAADAPERANGSNGKTEKCSPDNIDFKKFNPEWGKALIDRMSGNNQVKLENGETLTGGMSRLKSAAKEMAESFGCPDPSGSADEDYLYATIMIAVSCFESGWDPKNKFDERSAGGIRGAGNDAEANESRGLLQLTYKSDADSQTGGDSGCKAQKQEDMDNPIMNLMCGLAIIQRQQMKSATQMKGYWAVLRDPKAEKVKAQVQKQCKNGYADVRAFEGARSPASNGFGVRQSN